MLHFEYMDAGKHEGIDQRRAIAYNNSGGAPQVFILRPLWLMLRPLKLYEPQTGQPGELGKRYLQGTASAMI